MIKECPGLLKLRMDGVESVFFNITGEKIDYTKSLTEQGLDDLDGVEFIMGLEEKFNISIPDSIGELFAYGKYPIGLLGDIRQMHREKIINSIL